MDFKLLIKEGYHAKLEKVKLTSIDAFKRFIGHLDIKMVNLDLDGTTLNSKKEISQENLEAIALLRQKKPRALINVVTGRGFHNAERYAQQLSSEYFATDNGSSIFERKNGVYAPIKSFSMPEEDCYLIFNKIMEDLGQNPELVYHLSTDQSFIIGSGEEKFKRAHEVFYPNEPFGKGVIQVRNFDEIRNRGLNNDITKMCADFGGSEKGIYQLGNFVNLLEDTGINYFQTSPTKIEVAPEGINKYSAVSFIRERHFERNGFSIRNGEIMSVGDSGNDRPLLEKALQGFQSFCTGNADDNFKKELPESVVILERTNDEHAVADALGKFNTSTSSLPREVITKGIKSLQKRVPGYSLRDMNTRKPGDRGSGRDR